MASEFHDPAMTFRGLSDEEGDGTEEPEEIKEGHEGDGNPEGYEEVL